MPLLSDTYHEPRSLEPRVKRSVCFDVTLRIPGSWRKVRSNIFILMQKVSAAYTSFSSGTHADGTAQVDYRYPAVVVTQQRRAMRLWRLDSPDGLRTWQNPNRPASDQDWVWDPDRGRILHIAGSLAFCYQGCAC